MESKRCIPGNKDLGYYVRHGNFLILISIFLLLFNNLIILSVSHAKNIQNMSKILIKSVVAINACFDDSSCNNGFGFIIGEKGNSLYIVTANHVVRNTNIVPGQQNSCNIKILLFNYGEQYIKAILTGTYNRQLDLALLNMKKPDGYKWTDSYYDPSPRINQKVSFIGREGKWYTPSIRGEGSIHEINPITNHIKIDINTIKPGTSGAPLFSKNGIVGMIIEDAMNEAIVSSINSIKYFVQQYGFPWELNIFKEESAKNYTTTSSKQKLPNYIKAIKLIKNKFIISVIGESHQLVGSHLSRLSLAKMNAKKRADNAIKEKLLKSPYFFSENLVESVIKSAEIKQAEILNDGKISLTFSYKFPQ